MSGIWMCRGCAATYRIDHAAVFGEPGTDATCDACGGPPSDEEVQIALLRALLAQRSAVVQSPRTFDEAAPRPKRRSATAAGLLSKRSAAGRLGCGRGNTLGQIVAAGLLTPVMKGRREAFRAADVEALIERGYTLPDAPPRPAPAKKRAVRRHAHESDAAVRAELAKF